MRALRLEDSESSLKRSLWLMLGMARLFYMSYNAVSAAL